MGISRHPEEQHAGFIYGSEGLRLWGIYERFVTAFVDHHYPEAPQDEIQIGREGAAARWKEGGCG